MANTQSRSSGLFTGLVLLTVGLLLLMHNYGHLDIGRFFTHWWPLLIIFWGLVKLYERTAGRRFGGSGGGITVGEVLLVVGMLAVLGSVAAWDIFRTKVDPKEWGMSGDNYSFDDVVVPPQTIATGARVSVNVGRGDITLRASDDQQLRVNATKNVTSWSETEAGKIAKPVKVVVTKNGDGYEIRSDGLDQSDSRISLTLEIAIPKKSPISVKTEKGDVTISDQAADIGVEIQNGDVEIRNTTGDISVETRKGDVKVTDTNGNVKVTGKGGEIEVINATGSFTLDGDFYGPVRADKVVKGVRLITVKTDMTLSSLNGHMEAGTGNLDIVGAPGNLSVRTRDTEVSLENPGGKVNIDNRNASVNVRFSTPPKDDVSITNSSSEISLTLPGSSNFDLDAQCHDCDIDSEFSNLTPVKSPSGDAHITGKNGSARGPKIILKTSYGNIGLRRNAMTMPPKPPSPNVPNPPAPIEPPTEQ